MITEYLKTYTEEQIEDMCFTCANSIIMEDRSVGIWPYVDDCVSKAMPKNKKNHPFVVPHFCAWYSPKYHNIPRCNNCGSPYVKFINWRNSMDADFECDTCKENITIEIGWNGFTRSEFSETSYGF